MTDRLLRVLLPLLRPVYLPSKEGNRWERTYGQEVERLCNES